MACIIAFCSLHHITIVLPPLILILIAPGLVQRSLYSCLARLAKDSQLIKD